METVICMLTGAELGTLTLLHTLKHDLNITDRIRSFSEAT